MSRLLSLLTGVALLVAPACEEDAPSTTRSTTAPGWVQLHDQIFSKSCANSACHGGPRGVANLSFEDVDASYEKLVGVSPTNGAARKDGFLRVAPGDAAKSFLLWKLTAPSSEVAAHNYGARMPLAAFQPPGPASIAAITAWIEDGAPYTGVAFTADFVAPDPGNYVPCDATDVAGLRACFPDAPADPMIRRFYTPPMTLQPGTEHVICSRLDVAIDEPILIRKGDGFQMDGGHHAAIYVSVQPESDADPVECEDIDMSQLRFIIGAGGDASANVDLPDDVVLRINAGQQIIVQSHYINTGTAPRVVMDAVELHTVADSASAVIADSLALVDSAFSIPVGARGFQRTKTCTADTAIDIHMLLGHTHDFGTRFELELTRNGQSARELLYSATDGPTLRDNPDVVAYDPPLRLAPGDMFTMTCQWDNDTGHAVEWPEEMCVAFMYYSPGNGFLICDSDDATPVAIGGGASSCGVPSDVGNAKGVGEYCTDGGGQCADNAEATFCIAGFSDHSYCTIILCADDADCGADATCVQEDLGSACVPDYCD